jgi:hypothetical protein
MIVLVVLVVVANAMAVVDAQANQAVRMNVPVDRQDAAEHSYRPVYRVVAVGSGEQQAPVVGAASVADLVCVRLLYAVMLRVVAHLQHVNLILVTIP